MQARLILALGAAFACVGADDVPDYEDRTLEISPAMPVDLTINDLPATLLVRPDAASVPSINGVSAERFGFEKSMIAYRYRRGGVNMEFSSDVARYDMGSGRFRRRSAYGSEEYTPGVDGTVGPGGLPFGRVVFRLKPAGLAEQTFVFPMEKVGRRSVGTQMMLGEHEMHVAFSLSRRESLLTATAGSMVSSLHNGHFQGETRIVPIGYGIGRPVRSLSLSDPLLLGGFEVRNLAVRTQDFGDASQIAEEAIEPDPDEIVVTADTSGDDLPWLNLTVGLDTIGHCSSLTYDFEEETVTLICPEAPLPL